MLYRGYWTLFGLSCRCTFIIVSIKYDKHSIHYKPNATMLACTYINDIILYNNINKNKIIVHLKLCSVHTMHIRDDIVTAIY